MGSKLCVSTANLIDHADKVNKTDLDQQDKESKHNAAPTLVAVHGVTQSSRASSSSSSLSSSPSSLPSPSASPVASARRPNISTFDDCLTAAMDNDRYVCSRRIYRSIHGGLYHGLDKKTGTNVAIKISSLASMNDRSKREDPRREQQLLDHLASNHEDEPQHPGQSRVVRLLDAWTNTEVHVMVLELCEGGDLMDRLMNNNPLQGQELIDVARQLIEGVAFLHSKGIAHHDISPENILLHSDGSIKIIDFGLARLLDPCGKSSLPQPRECPGKHRYQSYEYRCRANYNPFKHDMFGVGVSLFVCMTGRFPFDVMGDRYWNLMVQRGVTGLLEHHRLTAGVNADMVHLIDCLLLAEHVRPSAAIALEHHVFRANEARLENIDLVKGEDDSHPHSPFLCSSSLLSSSAATESNVSANAPEA